MLQLHTTPLPKSVPKSQSTKHSTIKSKQFKFQNSKTITPNKRKNTTMNAKIWKPNQKQNNQTNKSQANEQKNIHQSKLQSQSKTLNPSKSQRTSVMLPSPFKSPHRKCPNWKTLFTKRNRRTSASFAKHTQNCNSSFAIQNPQTQTFFLRSPQPSNIMFFLRNPQSYLSNALLLLLHKRQSKNPRFKC